MPTVGVQGELEVFGLWGGGEAMVGNVTGCAQLMLGFLWYPSERGFYGTMGMEQVPQGCWVIQ